MCKKIPELVIKWYKRRVQAYRILPKVQWHLQPAKKTELKLTNVAQASLMELRLDYEDYLRFNGESLWDKDNGLRNEFIKRKVASNKMFKAFVDHALEQDLSVKVRYCRQCSNTVDRCRGFLFNAPNNTLGGRF